VPKLERFDIQRDVGGSDHVPFVIELA